MHKFVKGIAVLATALVVFGCGSDKATGGKEVDHAKAMRKIVSDITAKYEVDTKRDNLWNAYYKDKKNKITIYFDSTNYTDKDKFGYRAIILKNGVRSVLEKRTNGMTFVNGRNQSITAEDDKLITEFLKDKESYKQALTELNPPGKQNAKKDEPSKSTEQKREISSKPVQSETWHDAGNNTTFKKITKDRAWVKMVKPNYTETYDISYYGDYFIVNSVTADVPARSKELQNEVGVKQTYKDNPRVSATKKLLSTL